MNRMKPSDLLKFLRGKKTYLCATAIICLSMLYAGGVIDQPTLLAWLALFNGAGLAALRLAVGK